jgi:hypothetical protein
MNKLSYKGLAMANYKSIVVETILALALTSVSAAWAEHEREACAALVEARSALWSMIDAREKSAQDALYAKVQSASAKLDSVLASMTGTDAKVASAFKAVWDQFKGTRENEIVPAIRKGSAKDAKKIADSIQADRLARMWDIMTCKVR